MRALKRAVRRWRAYRAARPELMSCRGQLEEILGGPVTWRRTGGRGRDVVCLILRDGREAGVLRLTNPVEIGSTPPSAGMPFVSLQTEARLAREWHAYSVGYASGLTPRPLWRNSRGMLCAYVDAQPLDRIAALSGNSLLQLATDALPSIGRLHAAGLTHLDMSPANILLAGERHLFVDFEYGPAAGLSVAQQCLYDYLRLLESIWKLLDQKERSVAADQWGGVFLATAPAAVRAADREPLWPALSRVFAAPELRAFLNSSW